jgi:tetratricopeptide (TPR) repeat protein
MKKIVLLVLFLAVCVFYVQADQADDYFQQGKTAYQAKQYEKAFELFQKAVSLSPGTAKYQYNLGLAARKLNKYDIAASAFLEAKRLDPSISFTNDKEAFESKLEEMIRLSDSSTAGKPEVTGQALQYFTQGETAYEAKDYEKAYEFFSKAVAAEPGIAKYQYNLGLAARKLSKYTIARDAFLKAKQLDPNIGFTDNKEAFFKKLEEVTNLAGTEKEESVKKTIEPVKTSSPFSKIFSYGIIGSIAALVIGFITRKKRITGTGAGTKNYIRTNGDAYDDYQSHSTISNIGKKIITQSDQPYKPKTTRRDIS